MKKTRIIALILVIMITAGSFTGCFTTSIGTAGNGELLLITIPLDIVTLPIQLVYFVVKEVQKAQRNKRGKLMDGIDTFSHSVNSLPGTGLSTMTRANNSLPKAEIDSLIQKFNSLPEAEIASFTQTVNSLSIAEKNALIKVFNGLSEAEIMSSIETINSMPEEELVYRMNNLQHIEFIK